VDGNFVHKGLPDDLLTPQSETARRLKVSAQSAVVERMSSGQVFVGAATRTGVIPASLFYTAIETGANWLVVDNIDVEFDFSAISDGKFTYNVTGYVEISDISDFTYSGGALLPVGRSMNAALINTAPTTMVKRDVTADTLTGQADYPLFYASYFMDTSGNRQTLTSTKNSFFGDGRLIMIPPNSVVLVESSATGTTVEPVDISSVFFTREFAAEDLF